MFVYLPGHFPQHVCLCCPRLSKLVNLALETSRSASRAFHVPLAPPPPSRYHPHHFSHPLPSRHDLPHPRLPPTASTPTHHTLRLPTPSHPLSPPTSVVHEPSGRLEPEPARVRSSLLAARESWRVPLLRGHRCCAPSATSQRRENIYRCSRYMASGNKSTVFIFKWRVCDFYLVVSKEKGSVRWHPDSSRLESARVPLHSARFRSSLLAARAGS